jgi:hypothetical protein
LSVARSSLLSLISGAVLMPLVYQNTRMNFVGHVLSKAKDHYPTISLSPIRA